MLGKKTEIGDVLEIPTKLGLAYVQFSHYHEKPPRMGAVIRVLPGFFPERPKEFQAIADQEELYYTFFPVQAAVARKIFAVVGHAEVPQHAKQFPLFRAGNVNPATGKVEQWWLWDGDKSSKIDELSDEQLDLPIKSAWNDIMLIQRIEQGWMPRKAEVFIQAARLRSKIGKALTIKGIRHFLLYRKMDIARNGQDLLHQNGFQSEIMETGVNDGVMLVVRQPSPYSEEYVENTTVRLADIAEQSGGTYDAWETELG